MIDPSLLPEFIAEAGEHLDEMEANLIRLESEPGNMEILNDIFRDMHTIKGSSAYLGLKITSELAHKVENLLEILRQGKRQADPSLIDALIAAKDRITALVADIESHQEERTETDDLMEVIDRFTNDLVLEKDKDSDTGNIDLNVSGCDVHSQSKEINSSPRESEILHSPELEDFALDLDGINFDLPGLDGDSQDKEITSTLESSEISQVSDTEALPSLDLDGMHDICNPADDLDGSGIDIKTTFAMKDESNPDDWDEDDDLDESDDEELFTIFLEQLRDNLSGIHSLAENIAGSDNKSDLLSDIIVKIERLNSSANYMGYTKLIDLYDRWVGQLEEYQDELFLGAEVSLPVLINTGINSYIARMLKRFPQLEGIKIIQLESETSESTQKEKTVDINLLTVDLDSHPEGEKGQVQNDCQPGDLLIKEDDQNSSAVAPESSMSETRDDDSILADETKSSQQGSSIVESDRAFSKEIYEEDSDVERFPQVEEVKVLLAESQYVDSVLPGKPTISESLSFESETPFEENGNVIGSPSPALERSINNTEDDDTAGEDEDNTFQKDSLVAGGDGEIGKTVYEESSDVELFAVFLEQQQKNLLSIQDLREQLPASDQPSQLLETMIEKVKSLSTAANYMGYRQLTSLYNRWQTGLGESLDEFFEKDIPSVSGLIDTHINPYIVSVLGHLPQLEGITSSFKVEMVEAITTVNLPDASDDSAVISEITTSSNEDKVQNQLPSEVDEELSDSADDTASNVPVDRTAELFTIDEYFPTEEAPAEETDSKAVETDFAKREEQALINRLSNALDLSLGTGRGDETIMVASSEDQTSDRVPEDTEENPAWDTSEPLPVSTEFEDKTDDEERPISAELPNFAEPDDSTRAEDDLEVGDATVPNVAAESVASSPDVIEQRKVDRRTEERRSNQSSADKVFRQSLRVDANKIDELMNQAGELVINRAWFSQLLNEMKDLESYLADTSGLNNRDVKQVKGLTFKFNEAIVALGRVANELQEGVMKVRMLPISQLYNRYPRLVRDLVNGTEKEIQLEIRGADTELDKMIIEEISDPLIHIIRNSVDHGIETVAARKSLGKPEKGRLRLDAYHEGSHVVVEVADDGRGIDPEAIKAVALQKRLLNEDELARMTSKELVELIMRPGFSTADQITRTSGRGVGMDVVRKNLEKLNGTIEVDSQPGKGTRIRIKIPLTLAVIKALLVRVRSGLFTIPLIAVDETLQIGQNDISRIKGNEVIYLRDATIPLIRLSELFNLPAPTALDDTRNYVVVVNTGSRRVGLIVDELRGQEEVVIKPLPDYLQDNNGFSGATILGDGRISLILDIHELVQLSINLQNNIRDEITRKIREIA